MSAVSPLSRVVLLNDFSIARGGATTLVLLLLRLLRSRGIPVTIIVGDDGDNPEFAALGEKAIQTLDPTTWRAESFELAKEYVYDSEITTFLKALDMSGAAANSMACTVTEDYLKHGGKVSEKRVVEAGYRIGKVLSELQK